MNNNFAKGSQTSICLILFFFILVTYVKTYAQSEDEIWYNVVTVPPSPTASSLGKYSEIPVDKSTGIPNISIPILTLSEGNLTLPISLSYHAGGIKVQEEASWVGLGWSLNAGGVITRVMRGLPDEQENGYLFNGDRVPWGQAIQDELDLAMSPIDEIIVRLDNMCKGYIDYEPDLFYYNCGGISGSFMFDNHKNIITIPHDGCKILANFGNNKLLGFIITDPNGIAYEFGGSELFYEVTQTQTSGPDQLPFVSSWYVSRIMDPFSSDMITFQYSPFTRVNNFNNISTKLYEWNNFNYVLLNTNYNNSSTNEIQTLLLRQIATHNQIITFTSSSSEDGGKKLDWISSKNRVFRFEYSYFKTTPNTTDKDNIRLKLDTFREVNPLSEEYNNDKIYSFEYSSVNLPSKSSYAIDYWGYFNNKTANLSPVPKINYAGFVLGDADRRPDSDYTIAGSLTKINYPTGGYSKFTLENNAEGRFPTVDEISLQSGTGMPYFSVTGDQAHHELCNSHVIHESTNKMRKFVLRAFLVFSGSHSYENFGTVRFFDDGHPISAGIPLTEVKITDEQEVTIELPELLDTDNITMQYCANGLVTTLWCSLSYMIYDPALLEIKDEFAKGGLRIKQIESYDPIQNSKVYKTYDYNFSGYVNTPLSDYYYQVKDRRVDPSNSQIVDFTRLMLFADPVGGLGSSSNLISYEKVTEYDGTKEQNSGWVTSSYEYYEDMPTGILPHFAQFSYQYNRSIIKKEEFYRNNGANNFTLQKLIEYTNNEDVDHTGIIRGFKVSRVLTDHVTTQHALFLNQNYSFNNFLIFWGRLRLTQKKTYEFSENGEEIKSTELFEYDNPKTLLPSTSTIQASDGTIQTTIFKYPSDYVTCSENCDNQFETELDNCLIENFYECTRESANCLAIYGQANNTYYGCMNEVYQNYDNTISGLILDLNPLTMPFYEIKRQLEVNRCESIRKEILDILDYQGCLDALTCGYIPCQVDANINYLNCLLDYDLCVQQQYTEAENDPHLQGVLLMFMSNNQNEEIERIKLIDNTEVQHIKYVYDTKEVYPGLTKPYLKEAMEEIAQNGFISRVTYAMHDKYLHVLQSHLYDSTTSVSNLWGYNAEKLLIAQASNATYKEIGYTGFENNESNSFIIGEDCGEILYDQGFTGNYSIKVKNNGPSAYFKVGESAEQHSGYKASVWVKGSAGAYLRIQVGDEWSTHRDKLNIKPNTDWHLLEIELPRAVIKDYFSLRNELKIKVYVGSNGEDAYFDDLRFYPMDAQMTTFTYDPYFGITSSSDVNNKPGYYEYDALGRLTIIRDFEGNILNKFDYHFKE